MSHSESIVSKIEPPPDAAAGSGSGAGGVGAAGGCTPLGAGSGVVWAVLAKYDEVSVGRWLAGAGVGSAGQVSSGHSCSPPH